MTEWFYLAFGFSLFPVLNQERKARKKTAPQIFYTRVLFSLIALMGIDFLFNIFLWVPTHSPNLRWISIFFWALVIAQDNPQCFLIILGSCFWMVSRESIVPEWERWGPGFLLPVAVAVIEWIFLGLRERLQLADLPKGLQGVPLVFWMATILAMAFQGIGETLRLICKLKGIG